LFRAGEKAQPAPTEEVPACLAIVIRAIAGMRRFDFVAGA